MTTTLSKLSRAALRTAASRRTPFMAARTLSTTTTRFFLEEAQSTVLSPAEKRTRYFTGEKGALNNEKTVGADATSSSSFSSINKILQDLTQRGMVQDQALSLFLLEQLVQSKHHSEAPQQAHELLLQLHQDQGHVTDQQFCLALQVCAAHEDENVMTDMVQMVQDQQEREQELEQTLARLALKANHGLAVEDALQKASLPLRAKSLLYVVEAWARSTSDDATTTKQNLADAMDRLLEFATNTNDTSFPSRPLPMQVRAHALAGNVDRVEDLLTTMNWEYQEGNLQAKPDLQCYHWLLGAIAQTTDGGERAEAILDHMKMLYANRYDDQILHVDPTLETYQHVLKAYGNAKNGQAADQALEKMMDDFKEGKEHTTRTVEILNSVLEAWSNEEQGCTAALDIMKMFYKVGLMSEAPNVKSYALVMKSIWNSGKKTMDMKQRDILGLVKQAQGYLDGEPPKDDMELFMAEFQQSSDDSASNAEDANINTSESAQHQESITYHDMLPNGEANFTLPTTEVSTQEAKVLLIAKTELGRLQTQYCDGHVSFESVQAQMQAIRHFLPDSKEIRARAIGDLVLASAASSRDSDKETDETKDALTLAQEDMRSLLLTQYMGKQDPEDESNGPTIAKFNTLLDAMARSKSPGVTERMDAILNQMKGLYKEKKLDNNPNTLSYNSVILACAHAGEAKQAQAILEQLYEGYASGNQDMKPDLQSFSYVITAWARSGLPDGEERVEFLLGKMKEFLSLGVRKDQGILNLERAFVASVKNDKEETYERELEASRTPEYDGST